MWLSTYMHMIHTVHTSTILCGVEKSVRTITLRAQARGTDDRTTYHTFDMVRHPPRGRLYTCSLFDMAGTHPRGCCATYTFMYLVCSVCMYTHGCPWKVATPENKSTFILKAVISVTIHTYCMHAKKKAHLKKSPKSVFSQGS